MINFRRLRGALRHIFPESIKRRIRSRLFGDRPPSIKTDWSLVDSQGHVELHADGFVTKVPRSVRDSLVYHCFENGDSVEELRGFLDHAKNAGGMLFDVGAADGLFSTLYCLAGAGNRAVAYEPSKTMNERLVSLISLNGLVQKVEIVQAAVGKTTGQVGGWLNAAGMLIVDSSERAKVSLLNLDDELERLGPPAAVKIDVEGYEGEVLHGAQQLLATHRPLLFLEFHLDQLERQGVRVDDLLKMLIGFGYRFESSLGASLSARKIATSHKAIIRFIARGR